MVQCKLLLENNRYETWTWVTTDTRRTLNYDQDPWIASITRDDLMERKLLNHDIVEFTIVDNRLEKYSIIHSIVRQTATLAGVLLLQGNKTYGRKKNKYWYRCVPNDKRIPSFLIAYAWGGSRTPTFSKNPENKFVVFKYESWEGIHPRGTLLETLGNVSSLTAFYEYQLYCRSLQTSIQSFVKATRKALSIQPPDERIRQIREKYSVQDRTTEAIYSIDPKHCKDIDDAFSVTKVDDATATYRVSIYIACVPLWIDTLELWSAFSKRVSTIYLPDRKRPMLPTVLSEDLCSLHKNQYRVALAMDLIIREGEGIRESSFAICEINVRENYHYAHPDLLSLESYRLFHDLAVEINQRQPYIDKRVLTRTENNRQRVKQSHAVVSYWMIQMNYIVAKTLQNSNTGLFRVTTLQPCKPEIHHLPQEMLQFLQIWKSSGGSYVSLRENEFPPTSGMPPNNELDSTSETSLNHQLLDLDAYVHITSPIRRLPDLLNMIELIRVLDISSLSDASQEFYGHWCSNEPLEFMNTSMRAIRRVQQDCDMIAKITREPERIERTIEGYVFDGIVKTDGLYQYMVYFPDTEWRLITRCVSTKYCDEYSLQTFKIHLFNDGETMRRKIRVELL